MSCSLVSRLYPATLVALLLVGCAIPAPVEIIQVQQPTTKALKPPIIEKWLRWQEAVSTMDASQLSTVLEGMAEPGNANQLFYYGLLKQQSETYDDWVIARDIFRDLHLREALTAAQRQLAGLLERYNQSRINWLYSRDELQQQHDDLQQQLAGSQEQNQLLEQKIQAITDLESTISTRSEE